MAFSLHQNHLVVHYWKNVRHNFDGYSIEFSHLFRNIVCSQNHFQRRVSVDANFFVRVLLDTLALYDLFPLDDMILNYFHKK